MEYTPSSSPNKFQSPLDAAQSTNGRAAAALDALDRGFAVLPCWWMHEGRCACASGAEERHKAPGKHPLGDLVRHGLKDATRDRVRVEAWWRAWPNANPAIATGEPSGVWVLDIDPKDGGDQSLAALVADNGPLPATFTVRSGGGGTHYYFRHEGDLPNSQGKNSGIAPGIDVRSTGGYVLWDGSNHESGGEYRITSDVPVVHAPWWLIKAARAATSGKSNGVQRPSSEPETVDDPVLAALFYENRIDPVAYRRELAAMWADDPYGEIGEQALGCIDAWAPKRLPGGKWQSTGAWRIPSQALGRDLQEDLSIHPDGIRDFGLEKGMTPIDVLVEHCGAPDARTAALWLCEDLGLDPAIFRFPETPVDAFDRVTETTTPDPAPTPKLEAKKPEAKKSASKDGAFAPTLYVPRPAAEIPPRPWLHGRDTMIGETTGITGPGGVGKSMIDLIRAVECATERALISERIYRGGPAWYACSEDSEDEIHRRLEAIRIKYRVADVDLIHPLFVGTMNRAITFVTLDEGTAVVAPDALRVYDTIQKHGLIFMAIDPLIDFHDVDENLNTQMSEVISTFSRIARSTRCAIDFVAHNRKGGTAGEADSLRGATAIVNRSRSVLTVTRMTEEEAVRLKINPDHRKRYVRLDPAKGNYAAQDEPARWFELASVCLDNADDVHDADWVGVPVKSDMSSAYAVLAARKAEEAAAQEASVAQTVFEAMTQINHMAKDMEGVVCDLLRVGEKTARAKIQAAIPEKPAHRTVMRGNDKWRIWRERQGGGEKSPWVVRRAPEKPNRDIEDA